MIRFTFIFAGFLLLTVAARGRAVFKLRAHRQQRLGQ